MIANYHTYDVYNAETLYTLADANKILKTRKKIENRLKIYFLKQKLFGFFMLLVGILCPILMDGDATFSLIGIPLGLWLLITNRKIMDFR